MKKYIVLIGFILMLPQLAFGQESDQEYKALVDEVLELTGALKIGEQLSSLFVSQMAGALKASNSALPDDAFELIADEVNTAISESMESGKFHQLMHPIYAQHLSKADLKAMIAFYRTSAGRRIAASAPIMAQQGMQAGQTWGETLGPEIGERVLQRLRKKGYLTE